MEGETASPVKFASPVTGSCLSGFCTVGIVGGVSSGREEDLSEENGDSVLAGEVNSEGVNSLGDPVARANGIDLEGEVGKEREERKEREKQRGGVGESGG